MHFFRENKFKQQQNLSFAVCCDSLLRLQSKWMANSLYRSISLNSCIHFYFIIAVVIVVVVVALLEWINYCTKLLAHFKLNTSREFRAVVSVILTYIILWSEMPFACFTIPNFCFVSKILIKTFKRQKNSVLVVFLFFDRIFIEIKSSSTIPRSFQLWMQIASINYVDRNVILC